MAVPTKVPDWSGTTIPPGQYDERLLEEYKKLFMSATYATPASAVRPEKQKPSQPFNSGDQAYLHGVLAAMCAGHCKLKDIYTQVDQESLRTKIVAGFETTSKRYVLVPIDLPFQGSMVPDDWFLELKARIVVECGE